MSDDIRKAFAEAWRVFYGKITSWHSSKCLFIRADDTIYTLTRMGGSLLDCTIECGGLCAAGERFFEHISDTYLEVELGVEGMTTSALHLAWTEIDRIATYDVAYSECWGDMSDEIVHYLRDE